MNYDVATTRKASEYLSPSFQESFEKLLWALELQLFDVEIYARKFIL